jgi:hypothetical protein
MSRQVSHRSVPALNQRLQTVRPLSEAAGLPVTELEPLLDTAMFAEPLLVPTGFKPLLRVGGPRGTAIAGPPGC